jgi:hypothetical protein
MFHHQDHFCSSSFYNFAKDTITQLFCCIFTGNAGPRKVPHAAQFVRPFPLFIAEHLFCTYIRNHHKRTNILTTT